MSQPGSESGIQHRLGDIFTRRPNQRIACGFLRGLPSFFARHTTCDSVSDWTLLLSHHIAASTFYGSPIPNITSLPQAKTHNMSSRTCTRQRCDLRSRQTHIYASLSVDPDFEKPIISFAKWSQQPCVWTGIEGARLASKPIEFPSDMTMRQTLHSIDPTLEKSYIANLVDFAEDPSCLLTAADLRQMGNSVLDGKSLCVSVDLADRRLTKFRATGVLDNPQITADTWEGIRGRLVRLRDGQVGILQKYETECSRQYCDSRAFKAGQVVVAHGDGCAHKAQTIADEDIGLLPSFTGACESCLRPLLPHSLIFTNWLGGNPKHVDVHDSFAEPCKSGSEGE